MAEKIQIRSSFPEVPYLKSEIINKFGNIIVKTADRLEFKINSLILVSVSQLFKNFLKNIDDDIQEVVILSEFDSSDLKIFREFIMEGYLPKNPKSSKIEKIFQSFGIDLNRIINGNNFFSHSNNENIFDVEDIMKKIEEEDLLEVTPEINNTIFNQKNLTVELLDQVKKENSYCNQCDIQFCNQYSLENHISSIHPYLEFDQDNVEEIDIFDELFKADYEKILSKTQNSFGEIIDKVEKGSESLNEKSIQQNNLDHQQTDIEEYGVERIIDKNYDIKGQVHYLIKWKNYEEKDNTWEPIDNLYCKELIEEFEISYEANDDYVDKVRKNSQKSRSQKPLENYKHNSKNYRKVQEDNDDDFWKPDQEEEESENENSVKITKKSSRKRKPKYLSNTNEFETSFDENNKSKKMSKRKIKDNVVVDQPCKPEDENQYANSINGEIIDTSTSQITGLRVPSNKYYGKIGYKELCKFKEEVKNNFDVKIPPPDFTLEDYKNFVFPKPLEELEVIPPILAEHKYVVPTPGNFQCGVCGSFGLNNYPNIKDHHIKYHAIHYACPIDDCG